MNYPSFVPSAHFVVASKAKLEIGFKGNHLVDGITNEVVYRPYMILREGTYEEFVISTLLLNPNNKYYDYYKSDYYYYVISTD